MDLNTLWFIVIAFFFAGYFILEGFDFGVGMSLPFLKGKDAEESDARRTAAVHSIGPVWDGNEVWVITGGAAIFAAFPEWYASLFSGFYLPLALILLALIARGVALEWRGKVKTITWRSRWDWVITIGSFLPALLWGVAFTNIVSGVPLNEDLTLAGFSDGFLGLLNPKALLGGIVFVVVFWLHGAMFLGLKTEEPVRSQAHSLGKMLAAPAVIGGAAYLFWMQFTVGKGWTWVPLLLIVVFLVGALAALWTGKDKAAFWLTTAMIVGVAVFLFGSVFPNVLPSTSAVTGLDIYNASASQYTLTVMTWASVTLLPVVLVAQGWTYWRFRKRIAVQTPGAASSVAY